MRRGKSDHEILVPAKNPTLWQCQSVIHKKGWQWWKSRGSESGVGKERGSCWGVGLVGSLHMGFM